MPFVRRRPSPWPGLQSPAVQRPYALAVVFRRVLRIGPRVLLYLAVCIGLSIAFTQIILNRAPRHDETTWWSLRGQAGSVPSPFDAVVDMDVDTENPNDLRVIVFGGQDVATPDGKVLASSDGERAPSWTEVLCNELNCSTYHFFTPDSNSSQHPMISSEIYALAVEKLFQETDPSHGPGEDYSFQTAKFPIPLMVPGLAEQVTAFLDLDPLGATVPLDTLWVFTFGTWEVWSLATFPLEISRPFLSLMTQTIFEQADRLCDSRSWVKEIDGPTRRSRSPSDDVDTDGVNTDGVNTDGVNTDDVDTEHADTDNADTLKASETPMFRILIPELLDPSLLPAWKMSRPRLGRGHSKAMHMRNAALLTKQWNQEIHEKMDKWVLDGPDGRADGPLRDGFVFDGLQQYLVDAITEGQMRRMGEPRARPVSEGYRDVSRPCALPGRDEEEVRDCEAKGRHLFSTPFVAGTRAVRDIGVLAAEMVQSNKSQRALGRYVPPPQVKAWFESWDLGLGSRWRKAKRGET